MIAVRVGKDDSVEALDLFAQHLLSEVRPCVDDKAVFTSFYEDRGPQSLVSEIQ